MTSVHGKEAAGWACALRGSGALLDRRCAQHLLVTLVTSQLLCALRSGWDVWKSASGVASFGKTWRGGRDARSHRRCDIIGWRGSNKTSFCSQVDAPPGLLVFVCSSIIASMAS